MQRHIIVPLVIILIPGLFFGWLSFIVQMKIELFSTLLVGLIFIAGIFFQSGENRALQALEYKRRAHADLMESLAIFKISGGKTDSDTRKMTEVYFRSWLESSDKVYDKFSKYSEAYKEWSQDKGNKEKKEAEKKKFDELVRQIKKEVDPKTEEPFNAICFQLKEELKESRK